MTLALKADPPRKIQRAKDSGEYEDDRTACRVSDRIESVELKGGVEWRRTKSGELFPKALERSEG